MTTTTQGAALWKIPKKKLYILETSQSFEGKNEERVAGNPLKELGFMGVVTTLGT